MTIALLSSINLINNALVGSFSLVTVCLYSNPGAAAYITYLLVLQVFWSRRKDPSFLARQYHLLLYTHITSIPLLAWLAHENTRECLSIHSLTRSINQVNSYQNFSFLLSSVNFSPRVCHPPPSRPSLLCKFMSLIPCPVQCPAIIVTSVCPSVRKPVLHVVSHSVPYCSGVLSVSSMYSTIPYQTGYNCYVTRNISIAYLDTRRKLPGWVYEHPIETAVNPGVLLCSQQNTSSSAAETNVS